MNTDLAHDLTQAVKGEVRFDPYSRVLYSTDASAYQIEPLGVVIPKDRADVQAVLEIAAKHKVPVLARGGGSSLAGQAVGAAVVIDFSKYMRHILEINVEEHWVRAEPGVVCDALNAALKPHGLMYGPDPASSNRATVGGMLANNSTGAHSVLFGMTADHVLAVNALLADASPAHFSALDRAALAAKLETPGQEGDLYRGLTALVARHADTIRDRFPKVWRRASGYSLNYLVPNQPPPTSDLQPPTSIYGFTASQPAGWYTSEPYPLARGFNLAKLMVSSEGTLAVVTEAKLNVVPRPKLTALCVAHFDSVAHAADATPVILECKPSAIELIDAVMINLTRTIPAYARQLTFIRGNPGAILVVEFFGDTETELIAQIENLENHLRGQGLSSDFVRALTPREQDNVWGVRKVALGILQSMKGEAKPLAFMEDVAVPVDRLGEYVRATERLFQEFGVGSAYYAHASAGCLHIRPVVNLKKVEGVQMMRAIGAAIIEVVIAMGGAMSGEHGDGYSRSVWNGKLFGPELYGAFREVKRLFDPENRLNPGKIVDAPDMTENLRYAHYHSSAYQLPEIKTQLNFPDAGGFIGAIEQCNGAGVCRKADGTMCPSYMATRDEEHSTRGRANALRAALAGRLPPGALTSARMRAVLDLCLECKACKAECPSGVDMAKIKYEFLAQYQSEHGVPLRSRFFAHINTLSRLAAPFAPLLNPALKLAPVRWLNEKILGIAPERVLPPFALQTFRDWHKLNYQSPIPNNLAPLILFVDTFTNYNHPEIGIAAVKVLEAAGYGVLLAEHGCCGRPMISKGLLTEAKAAAAHNVAVLDRFAEQGLPIIGLEPSCLLTLRDEYLDLLPADPRVRRVAEKALLIEEFLSGLAERGELKIKWKPEARQVLVHGHCYQKALTGTDPLLKMLRLPGWDVTEINSGCCGMAGSFGYEAEHYALSQTIGGERLFPAVTGASAGTLVAASGMSCRHQIESGTGRVPHHPIQLLADAIA